MIRAQGAANAPADLFGEDIAPATATKAVQGGLEFTRDSEGNVYVESGVIDHETGKLRVDAQRIKEAEREAAKRDIAGQSTLEDFVDPGSDLESMGAAPNPYFEVSESGEIRPLMRSAADLVGTDRGRRSKDVEKFTSPNTEFEDRFQAARHSGRASAGTNLKRFWEEIVKKAARGSLPELPKTEQFGEARAAARLYRDAASISVFRVEDLLARTVKPLSAANYGLFERLAIMRDLVETNGELPFGLTEETAAEELERLENVLEDYPEVTAALDYRREWRSRMVADYVSVHEALGIDLKGRFYNDDGSLKRANYFRHQVLFYLHLRELDGFKPGGSTAKAQAQTGRGFLKKREGSKLDINAKFLEAEWEVSTQMLGDTKRAEALNRIRVEYDIIHAVKQKAGESNFITLVGGAENANRIYALRSEIAESLAGEDANESDVKLLRKGLREQLENLDPTLPFRRRIAIARKAVADAGGPVTNEPGDGLDVLEGDSFWKEMARVAADDTHPASGAARGFFKAVNEKRQFIKDQLGDRFLTWEDLVPATHVKYAYRPGRPQFLAHTIPENIAQQLNDLAGQELGITKNDVKQIMAIGGDYTPMVLPREIAAQLEVINDRKTDSLTKSIAKMPTRLWKTVRLLGPTSIFKYNLRNASEIEKVMFTNPQVFATRAAGLDRMASAARDLALMFSQSENMPREVRGWAERGGGQRLVRVNELGQINELKRFHRLVEKKKQSFGKKAAMLPITAWRKYWETVGLATDMRESILRYMLYREYLAQIEASPTNSPANYGASVASEIDGIRDIRDKAMRLSSDVLGDYSDVSEAGQTLRAFPVPFWAFQELDMRFYTRATVNIARSEKSSIKLGRRILRGYGMRGLLASASVAHKIGWMAALYFGAHAALTAWNRLFFPDEDDELPFEVQRTPHIVFGRDSDGNVLYFSRLGTATDFLEWIGADSVSADLRDLFNGTRSLKDIAQDWAASPVNKAINSVNPFIKTAFELSAQRAVFPDVRRPRAIRDSWRYVAQQWGFQREYDAVVGKPGQKYLDGLENLAVYSAEPRRADYFAALDLRREYSKKLNKGGGYSEGPRTDALRNYKAAIHWKDERSANRYLQEYIALGGTQAGLNRSLETMDPLYGLNREERLGFMATLRGEERRRVERAYEYYETVLLGKHAEETLARATARAASALARPKPERPGRREAETWEEKIAAWESEQKTARAWLESRGVSRAQTSAALEGYIRAQRVEDRPSTRNRAVRRELQRFNHAWPE
jgi:hypothetical protein